ncbi:MAG TPA: DUF3108 domain-containing protein [Myxococcaceae bacterium]|jgi:hypothetical protein
MRAALVLWALAAAGAEVKGVTIPPPPPQENPVRRAPVKASVPVKAGGPVKPLEPVMPVDAQCPGLPAVRPPFPFVPGEALEYDLDALGMVAGKLRIGVRPVENGTLPIRVDAETNTLFSKIRKVTGGATSTLNPKTLRPFKYLEDATENGVRKMSSVRFRPGERALDLEWIYGPRNGKAVLRYGGDGLDVAGAIYLLRTLPWKVGMQACFDVFSLRRIWRLTGKVESREHVSLPLGEFEAWYLSGVAVGTDDQQQRREVHVWLSDDAKRLPLVVVGTIDLGAVRATLREVSRPGEKRARGEDPRRSLKW